MALTPFSFHKGATVRRKITVVNAPSEGGGAKDLTGASVEWNLYDQAGNPAFSPSKSIGGGITYEGAPTAGVLVVVMTDAETAALTADSYRQEWQITDGLGDVQIYTGPALALVTFAAAA